MKKLIILISLLSPLMLGGCGFEIVDTGNRGIKTVFGEVDEEMGSLKEGLYFYNPFTSDIKELDTKIIRFDGVNETYTKDVQKAKLKYVVNYHLNPLKAHIIFRDVGRKWEEKLVPQIVDGTIKKVVGQWEAVPLIENRAKATNDIFEAIQIALKEKNVFVKGFELVDISYQPTFEQAVEAKVTAVQKAIEAENKTRQIAEEAKQKLITAEADAKAMTIKSEALAQSQSLIWYTAVTKWDGVLPQYMLGDSTMLLKSIEK